jgi:hypothetical protein
MASSRDGATTMACGQENEVIRNHEERARRVPSCRRGAVVIYSALIYKHRKRSS